MKSVTAFVYWMAMCVKPLRNRYSRAPAHPKLTSIDSSSSDIIGCGATGRPGRSPAGCEIEEQERAVRELEHGGPVPSFHGVVDLDGNRVRRVSSHRPGHRAIDEPVLEIPGVLHVCLVLDTDGG